MDRAFEVDGKTAIVATMHGKQRVIEPVLARLGLRFLPSPTIDTDRFGTFTREITRNGSQREAVLAKAQAGLDLCPASDFAIASEGAFGPNPQMPLLPAGFEMVVLLERASGRTIVGSHLSTATTFAQCEAATLADVYAFAEKMGFPSHAIVLMAGRYGPVLAKGVTSWIALEDACRAQAISGRAIWVEADMRAHLNPTRMDAVAQAAFDLVRRLQARCPACTYPDWTPRLVTGRPCAWCNGPTIEAWIEEYVCEACGNRVENAINPERKGDPGHCGFCNP